jgi:histidine triad (HIT) family protein
MSTIFSKIISGELPAHIIAEDNDCLCFLDINPLHKGHALVIPKKETNYIFDIAGEDYAKLWGFAKEMAHAIGKAVPCERIGVAVIGLEVAHAHIHLVPINSVADIDFSKPKLSFSPAELAATAQAIKAEL